MTIRNVHERVIGLPIERARPLLASLASADDALWPHRTWPPMRLDRGLSVGSRGGHAGVRYRVEKVSDDVVGFRFIPRSPSSVATGSSLRSGAGGRWCGTSWWRNR